MEVLIISYNIPFPLNNGGAIAQYYFLEKNIGVNYTFLTNANNTLEFDRVQVLIKNLPHVKFKIYKRYGHYQIIIDMFRKILFRFPKFRSIISSSVRKKKSEKLKNDILFAEYINKILIKNKFDWIQYEFFEAINLINLTKSNIKKIAIVHEIRSKRIELEGLGNDYCLNNLKQIEFSTLNKFDRIAVFNKKDKDYLRIHGVNPQILFSPFSIPEKLIKTKFSFDSINHFLFLGSQFHTPNKIGLISFLNNIYLKLPIELQLPICVVGEWDFELIQSYKFNSNIKFIGNLPVLDEVFKGAILLCPILSGSGIRTKVLESLFNGVPVISTPIGSEGLYDQFHNNHIFIYNDLNDFIYCVKTLLNYDKNDFIDFNNNIIHFLNDNFEFNSIIGKRLNCYE